MTPEALTSFYKEALGKAGWKPTTEKPVQIDFYDMMFFRNEAKDIAILRMHKFEGKLRVNLEHQTAAEFDEETRLARPTRRSGRPFRHNTPRKPPRRTPRTA